MMFRCTRLLIGALVVAWAGCATDELPELPELNEPPATATLAELDSSLVFRDRPLRIQSGAGQILLGVTDDYHALTWQAGTVYATALLPGAPRRVVATAAQPPLTMVVGRVALVWTAQPYFAAPAVSPLVVWTAARGPRAVTGASWSPALSAINANAAISPDSHQVLVTANVSADGATGDIVRVTTDRLQTTTLLTGVSVSPFSACAPHIGFDRSGQKGGRWRWFSDDPGDADASRSIPQPVITACPGDNLSAARLSRWSGGTKTVLSDAVAPGLWWTSDRRGEQIFTQLTDLSSVVFDRSGAQTVVESRRSLGWIEEDGTVFTRVRTSPTSVVIQRSRFTPALVSEPVTELGTATGLMFANHLPQGISFYNLTPVPTSPDNQVYGGFSQIDPSTGLTDVVLVDVSGAGRAPVALRSVPDVLPSFEITTRDSSHLVFYAVDVATLGTTMFAGARDGTTRQITDGVSAGFHYGTRGSTLVYTDNAVGLQADPMTNLDIRIVDVGAAQLRPRTLARQAHALFFLTRDRSFVVYTSDAEAGGGLYVVRADS